MMTPASLRFAAPADLRTRIEGKLPKPAAAHSSRRAVIKGFAGGAALSAIAASGVLVMVMRTRRPEATFWARSCRRICVRCRRSI